MLKKRVGQPSLVHSRRAPSLSVHFRTAKKTTSLSFVTLPPPLEGFSGNRWNSPRSSQITSRRSSFVDRRSPRAVRRSSFAARRSSIAAFLPNCFFEVVTFCENLRENFGTRHVKLQAHTLRCVWLAHSLFKHPQRNCGLFGAVCRPAALWSTQKLSHNYQKEAWLFGKSREPM